MTYLRWYHLHKNSKPVENWCDRLKDLASIWIPNIGWCCSTAHSMFATSQWETSLQSNAIFHWLVANLKSALLYHAYHQQNVGGILSHDTLCMAIFLIPWPWLTKFRGFLESNCPPFSLSVLVSETSTQFSWIHFNFQRQVPAIWLPSWHWEKLLHHAI